MDKFIAFRSDIVMLYAFINYYTGEYTKGFDNEMIQRGEEGGKVVIIYCPHLTT